MKKRFGLYTAAWAVLLVLFNVIAFVAAGFGGAGKFTASFWSGYIFITIMLIGQLVCAYIAFKADNAKKMFYNVSLIHTSYIGLVVSFVVGGLCMAISAIPYWIGIILCAVILAVTAISVIKATAAIEEIERIDEKVKVQTFFMKSLTVDAEGLVSRAKSESIKEKCKKVYEAVRYSDPMSNEALASVESEITVRFSALSDAVIANDSEAVATLADEVIVLIEDRNKKCKLLK